MRKKETNNIFPTTRKTNSEYHTVKRGWPNLVPNRCKSYYILIRQCTIERALKALLSFVSEFSTRSKNLSSRICIYSMLHKNTYNWPKFYLQLEELKDSGNPTWRWSISFPESDFPFRSISINVFGLINATRLHIVTSAQRETNPLLMMKWTLETKPRL